jgi:hypothetical protein
MGSQLGFVRGERRPNDVVWLDPIDIAFGRLTALKLPAGERIVALGAMSYTYLKITLSLRKAGLRCRAARLRLAPRHRDARQKNSPRASRPTDAKTSRWWDTAWVAWSRGPRSCTPRAARSRSS